MSQTPGPGGFHHNHQQSDGRKLFHFHQQSVSYNGGGQQVPAPSSMMLIAQPQMLRSQFPPMPGMLPPPNFLQQAADLHNQAHAQAMQQHAQFMAQRSPAQIQQALPPSMPQQAQIGYTPSQAATPEGQCQQYQQQQPLQQQHQITAPPQGFVEEQDGSSEEGGDTDSEDERQVAEAARVAKAYQHQKEENERQRKHFDERQLATEKNMQTMQRIMAEQQRENQEQEVNEQRRREQDKAQRKYDEQVRLANEAAAKEAKDQALAAQKAAHEAERRQWQVQQAQEQETREAKENRRREKAEHRAQEKEAKEAAKLEKQHHKEEQAAAKREEERQQAILQFQQQQEKQNQDMAAMRQQLEYERSQKFEIEQSHSRELAALAAQSASWPQTGSAELQKVLAELQAHSLKDRDVARLVEETMSRQLQGVARSEDLENSVAKVQKSLGQLPASASAADVQDAVSKGIDDMVQKAAARYGKLPQRQAIEYGGLQQRIVSQPGRSRMIGLKSQHSTGSSKCELKALEAPGLEASSSWSSSALPAPIDHIPGLAEQRSKREPKALPAPGPEASKFKSIEALPAPIDHTSELANSVHASQASYNTSLARAKYGIQSHQHLAQGPATDTASIKLGGEHALVRSKKSSKAPAKANQSGSSKPLKPLMPAPMVDPSSFHLRVGLSKVAAIDAVAKANPSEPAFPSDGSLTARALKQLAAPASGSHHTVAPSVKPSDGNAVIRVKHYKEPKAAQTTMQHDDKAVGPAKLSKTHSATSLRPLAIGALATFSQLHAEPSSGKSKGPGSVKPSDENAMVRQKKAKDLVSVEPSGEQAVVRQKKDKGPVSIRPGDENAMVRYKKTDK
ncbi:hypothetical protein LTR78_000197 [Recurvomyces mirabilis]|uniref:Uncharacterized protein n=1 Tax=Recurvomyces mirabilis TaxID=574656 RepID=A0AAE1C6D2_9PEZI|nr:hypothetical protein LTR78_000197 [Recurvomyces mirabilis]KAK5161854.1 hypothetical protein LTS14_000199 [Recurvomyces mirabilis]